MANRASRNALPCRKKGRQHAHAMFTQLHGDPDLIDACDPGYDEGSYTRPMRNIVLEYLDDVIAKGDREYLKGYCDVLTGYIAVCVGGGLPSATDLRAMFQKRERCERKVAKAQADPRFRAFLQHACASGVAGD